nr:MAG TPA: hypothetical protein [Crassvirales sp.]
MKTILNSNRLEKITHYLIILKFRVRHYVKLWKKEELM